MNGPPSSQFKRRLSSSSEVGSEAESSAQAATRTAQPRSASRSSKSRSASPLVRPASKARKATYLGHDQNDDLFELLDEARNYTEPVKKFNALDVGLDGQEVDEVEKKPRKPVAKIDPQRLLGPNGFKTLVRQSQGWKFQGKGHEMQDLRSLLGYYGLWTHQLLPKSTFKDTVTRIEKVCRTRHMQQALQDLKQHFESKTAQPREFTREPTAVEVRMLDDEEEWDEEVEALVADRAARERQVEPSSDHGEAAPALFLEADHDEEYAYMDDLP